MFSNAGMYSVGILLNRFGYFLLLPVYWQKLNPEDFGLVGLAQIITIFLAPVLGLGLYDSVQRLYYEWSSENRPKYLAALWITSLLFSITVCFVLYVFGSALFSTLLSKLPYDPYVKIMIITAFFNNLALFPLTLMRLREELRKFTVITVSMFITQSSLILYFIYAREMGALGYLLGMMINSSVWGVIFIYFMFKEMSFDIRVSFLKAPLRYSLPTVPASVLDGVGSIFDRIFLDKFATLQAIGLYNLGYQFGTGVNSFNQIMKSSWVPFIIRVITDRNDGPDILSRFSLYYVAAMAFPALLIALLSKEVIHLFGGDRYAGVYPFVPYFVLIYYIQAIGTAMGRGIDLAKKTVYSPIIPIVTIVVNFLSMWILVPMYGVWGAVSAFLITTLIRIGTHIGLALYFYPRPHLLQDNVLLLVIVISTFLVGYQVDTGYLIYDLLAKVLVIFAGMAILMWSVLDWDKAVAVIKSYRARIK